MNIFNSLGSNYNFKFVFNSFSSGKDTSQEKLIQFLEKTYQGKAILTYKGRHAISRALELLQLSQNDGVAVTGFTCIAVVDTIEKQKLKPIYLDIDPQTLNFSAELLEQKIKQENIKAVIIQNTLGYPCDIVGIKNVCDKHNVVLIEDLAHSIGTVYENGVEAGIVGDFVVMSFSQDKVVDAVSGGALVSRSQKLGARTEEKREASFQDRAYPFLTFLIRKTYPVRVGKLMHVVFRTLGLLSDPMKNENFSTLPNWHARLILSEFKNLKDNLEHRRKIAKIYAEKLDSKVVSHKLAKTISNATNLRFPIFVQNREKLIKHLKKRGVYISDIWYDSPVSPKKYLGLARYPKSLCPRSEEVSEHILNLPTHRNVSEKNALEISQLINQWLR